MNPSFVFPNLDNIKDVHTAQQLKNYQHSQNIVRLTSTLRTREKVYITPLEAEEIIKLWKLRNFGEFNNWVQTAKGKGDYVITDKPDQWKKNQKVYTCKGTVAFQDLNIPVYSHTCERKSRKEAKFHCQEMIVKDIIKDGWISLGFKEDDFMLKVRQLYQEQKEIYKPSFKTEEEEEIDVQTSSGLRTGISLPPIPESNQPTQEQLLKNRIHKQSRRMQELLKEDKFMDACQELCKIINKKAPDWNELHSIWCYGVMKKNIVYLKCILDLVMQKSYVAQKNEFIQEKPTQGFNPDQKQQLDEKTAQKLANQELLRKYGENLRLQSNNPFDVMDSYNVLLNKPDIDEKNTQIISDKEAEQQLLKNPTKDFDSKLHIAKFSEEETKRIREEFKNYKNKIQDMGLISKNSLQESKIQDDETWGSEPRKKVQTEEEKVGAGPLKPGQEKVLVAPKVPKSKEPSKPIANPFKMVQQIEIEEANQKLQKEEEQKKIENQKYVQQNVQQPQQLNPFSQQQTPVHQQPQTPVHQLPQTPGHQLPQTPGHQLPQTPVHQVPQTPQYQEPFSRGPSQSVAREPSLPPMPQQAPPNLPQKKGFTEQPTQEANIQYQRQLENYINELNNQRANMDPGQYQNLLYYYTSLLEQQRGQNQGEIIADSNPKQSDGLRQQQNSQLITPQFDYVENQKQQQYIKSNLNQDLLQEKVLKNLTGNKKAFLVQSDEVPIIDTKTAREVKDKNTYYLSYRLLREMYDQLLYCGDLNFALNIAELMYTKIKIDDSEFINAQACHYWSNKMNMIMVELLESIFQVFAQNKSKPVDYLMNVNGTFERIGNKQTQEVLVFTSNEPRQQTEIKVLKRGQVEGKDSYNQIAEGEFVMITSLSGQVLPTREEIIKNEMHKNIDKLPLAPTKNPFSIDKQYSGGLRENQSLRVEGVQASGSQNSTLLKYITAIAGQDKSNQSSEQRMFYDTVTEQGKSVEYAMIGYVRAIERDLKIKVFVLPTPEQSAAIDQIGRQWKMTKLVNKTTHEKTMDALDIFCTKINMSHTINQILMTPPICNAEFIKKLSESTVAQTKQSFVINTNLNQSQQTALKKASTQALTLIQGPPGTGKTTTAVEIVLEWIRQSPQPILACADSNVAVDILHCEFQKAGLKAIRIGPGYDERNEIHFDPRYKNYKIQQHLGNSQQAMNIKYSMMKGQIEQAQVICATNVGSMSDYIDHLTFTRVIVDEATQSTEVTCLLPIIKGCQQCVLIGDHKQLPPTVLSTFAQSKGMTVSLFERLIKQGVKPNMLIEQYRMHPSIAVFPSHQFYNNMLQNGVGEVHRPIIKGFKWPNQYVRVAIINVNGYEQIYSSSVQNNKEVEVVIEILLQMIKTGYVKISQVGIITPYDAQKRRIRNEINHQAKKFPHFFGLTYQQVAKLNRNSIINDVDTVDGYQGMERDVIIISTVRSNAGGNLGFLKDPRRMNVALTRAKRGLIIVGNIETLSSEENWRDLINWGKANKIIINYY